MKTGPAAVPLLSCVLLCFLSAPDELPGKRPWVRQAQHGVLVVFEIDTGNRMRSEINVANPATFLYGRR